MTELKRPKEVTLEFPQPPQPYPPSQRSGAFIGPNGMGKTTTALAMLMGPYRNVYSRVYVFSPSCAEGVDPLWDAWRKHIRKLGIPDEEQTMWSTWEPQILEELIERHTKVNAHLKRKRHKKGYVILALVDDSADQGDRVMHSSTNTFDKPICTGASPGCGVLDVDAEVADDFLDV